MTGLASAPLAGRLATFALAASLAAWLGGCSTPTGIGSPPASSSAGPSASGGVPTVPASAPGSLPAPDVSAPTSPVTGIITKVDSAGLASVSGFTLRTDAGQTLVLAIGTLENGAQFPPGHLAEHLATAAAVRVWFRQEGGRLVVYRIEDAA